jgi:hypothetical protein
MIGPIIVMGLQMKEEIVHMKCQLCIFPFLIMPNVPLHLHKVDVAGDQFSLRCFYWPLMWPHLMNMAYLCLIKHIAK